MNYRTVQREFVERTLKIIDQYEELVREKMPAENQYEVTLLMNCLLGLLVFPQQIATQEKGAFNDWLLEDKLIEVGAAWGLDPAFVIHPGRDSTGVMVTMDQLTLRKLLRQMRNLAAHAQFEATPSRQGNQVSAIVFHDIRKSGDGFHLRLPAANLKPFVRKLAESYLDVLKGK